MMLKTLAGNLVPTFIRSTSVSDLDLCFFNVGCVQYDVY